jgi:hypothetical protein
MATKKAKKAKEAYKDTGLDVQELALSFYSNYKKPIFGLLCIVLLIVIYYTYYTISTKSAASNAWTTYSEFQIQHRDDMESITQTDIQDLIGKVQNTTAEPWIIYYCMVIYIKKGDLKLAEELGNSLIDKHKDHYICKNDLLLQQAKNTLGKEIEWQNKIVN